MTILEGVRATIVSRNGKLVHGGEAWAATIRMRLGMAQVADASTQQDRLVVKASCTNGHDRSRQASCVLVGAAVDSVTDEDLVVALEFDSPEQLAHFQSELRRGPRAADGEAPPASPTRRKAPAAAARNAFDAKMDRGSSDLYFHYYGMLQHQQNMLQDVTRTGTYYSAILENVADFAGKTVMDVGAGSGILSLFAAQAGAALVYAVEASGMAKFAQQLAAANPHLGSKVQVIHDKVEEVRLPEGTKVDVLVSEPMGTLLVNERMLETYLYARDHFLKPGGQMFPALGRIHAAAFSDVALCSELHNKATFWTAANFYGVNLSSLHGAALEGYFSQVVVDAFDPGVLVSNISTKVVDFRTVQEQELHDITIPLDYTVVAPCTVHGIACWFDVLFDGSSSPRWLTTAPGQPTTHWFQLRCVLQQPVMALQPNTRLTGTLRLTAHQWQSYDVWVELNGPPLHHSAPPQQVTGKFDLKEPYYRQLVQWPLMQQQAQQQQAHQQQALQQQPLQQQ